MMLFVREEKSSLVTSVDLSNQKCSANLEMSVGLAYGRLLTRCVPLNHPSFVNCDKVENRVEPVDEIEEPI